jgi:uncharacterized membrane protein
MNDIIEIEEPRGRSLKNIGHVSYLLHLVVAVGAVLPGIQASVVLLLVAFVLDLVKRDDAAGTWQETHFRWRIRSVLWAGGLYLITVPLWLLLIAPGWIAWAIISVWFLYRIVRGWVNLSKNAAMPT